jgi:hypothetical protein
MADYDNGGFTRKILDLYAETLRKRLTRVKFMLDDGSEAIKDAIESGLFRLVRDYGPSTVKFSLDGYMLRDGSINQDMLASSVAEGLSRPVLDAAETELKPEENDPIKRIGAGQVWVFHKAIPVPDTLGAAQVHFASSDNVGVFGQTWFDNDERKTMFIAKTVWALARSNEVKKEVLDIDSLRQKT